MTFSLARKVRLDVGSSGHLRISGFDDPDYLVMLVEKAAGVKSAKSVENDALIYFEPYNAKKVLDSVTAELNNVRIPHEVVGVLASKIESFASAPIATPKPVMMMGGKQMLNISQIRRDGGTQPRAEIDAAKIEEYVSDMADGAEFPPVVVFYDGSSYWLADGFHRLQAAQKNLRQSIMAEIHQGTQREAILYSVGANATHGLKRSNEDKRRAVARLLSDEEWGKWSNIEIAKLCKVSDVFVGKLRNIGVTPNVWSENPNERTFTDKHGNESTMNVANIGAKVTIPDSLLWLPERLRKAVINGYHNLSLDHLQALAPLENLNTIGAPMVATMHFDKRTDIPTPQALYNRLSTLGGLSDHEVATVVKRMVAVCKPSANEVDLSDFTEDDFAEIGAAGEVQPSEADFETGLAGYVFENGGKAVLCQATNEVMSLEQFAIIKELAEAKAAKTKRKSASHASNGSSGNHTRTAAEIQGDRIANGYVAQVERANNPRQFMVRELGKMDNGALVLLAAAIAKAIVHDDELFNEISFIADFVMNEVSGE